MTLFGGIAPGTFQAWELNLPDDALLQAGIARGLQVGQHSPIGMSVVVGVDASSGDGIAFMPSGAWIDTNAAITLTISNNGGASPRTDAVVATSYQNVSTSPSIVYTNNWTGGFSGGTSDQLVLALVTVPVSSTGIVAANIQQNTAIASAYNALLAVNANNLTAGGIWWTNTSAYGMGLVDDAANGYQHLQPIVPVGSTQRGVVLDWTDTSNTNHAGIGVNQSGSPLLFGVPVFPPGVQDHGHCGIGPVGTVNGQVYAQGVNFHGVMTNVPTNISIYPTIQANGVLSIARISKYGFDFVLTCTGAGAYGYADYITVGN